MTPEEQVRGALNAYVRGTPEVPGGGMPALQAFTGPDPVTSPVFWEAIRLLGTNRRALQTGRRYRGGIDKWDRGAFNAEEQRGDDAHTWKGGNV